MVLPSVSGCLYDFIDVRPGSFAPNDPFLHDYVLNGVKRLLMIASCIICRSNLVVRSKTPDGYFKRDGTSVDLISQLVLLVMRII